jgi:hypothetical protein
VESEHWQGAPSPSSLYRLATLTRCAFLQWQVPPEEAGHVLRPSEAATKPRALHGERAAHPRQSSASDATRNHGRGMRASTPLSMKKSPGCQCAINRWHMTQLPLLFRVISRLGFAPRFRASGFAPRPLGKGYKTPQWRLGDWAPSPSSSYRLAVLARCAFLNQRA